LKSAIWVVSLFPQLENDINGQQVRNLVSWGVDRLIVFIPEEGNPVKDLVPSNIPTASFDRTDNHCDVFIDRRMGGQLATQHLLDHGYRNLAFLTDSIPQNRQNLQGFTDALQKAGLDPSRQRVIEVPSHPRLATLHKLNDIASTCIADGLKGVFVSGDFLAADLMVTLHRNGVRIPQDVAVIGFDNNPLCQRVTPQLTSVHQPVGKMAEMLVDLLFARMNHQPMDDVVQILEPHLALRESCGCTLDPLATFGETGGDDTGMTVA
jgi:DNA-binding LacI/PurR family transcriptional regulator